MTELRMTILSYGVVQHKQGVLMRNGNYVYAEMFCNWPLGYMEYYENKYKHIAKSYYNKYPTLQEEINDNLYKQRWHFVNRVMKTHSYSIPRFVIDMKIKKFVKEVVDKVLENHRPKQLEFNFD